MKTKHTAALILIAFFAALGFGCSAVQLSQARTAINTAAPAFIDLAKVVGEVSGNSSIVAGAQAANVIYAAYEGQAIPASSINTGSAKVDAALKKVTALDTPVTRADVAAIAALAAPK